MKDEGENVGKVACLGSRPDSAMKELRTWRN